MTKYGYARVSTQGQDLKAQVETLKAEGCEVIYSEKFTGTTKDRPEFKAVLDIVQSGDTLVVTKLDRFARSAEDAIHVIKQLHTQGVRVHILNMGMVDNTATGKLLLTVLAGFAEFERDMIVERLNEGKAIAKQREGYREGRKPKYTKAQLDHAMKLKETHSFTQVVALTNIPIATLKRESAKRKANAIISE
ncbi:DNA invertase Pin-like site-specific DNA recombinase [Solibacillus kalamii]|uniref:Resolvase n=1 Tax=Solibacillus kalamii TaxID=1748298 RepID=A0ABX3ZHF9_9BACL|nr:recombinase family protein [Solibacillus kalamii]MBM7663570.1 DNA invertase Pin-like site-specific DNA recombinase [Solibacillus kalamii]OUZ39168.1 resolvase [Solibacillus kalamii]